MSATLRDAIADIRSAAQQAATLGGDWYLSGDMARLLPPEDGLLLIACEPVRLLAILDAAEKALQDTANSGEAQVDGDRLADVGPALRMDVAESDLARFGCLGPV